MPPLDDVVDPDALDTLAEGSCRVVFDYAGYAVTVPGPRGVAIHERGDREPAGPWDLPPRDPRDGEGAAEFGLSCRVCGWVGRVPGDGDRSDVSEQALDHYLDTGHAPIRRR